KSPAPRPDPPAIGARRGRGTSSPPAAREPKAALKPPSAIRAAGASGHDPWTLRLRRMLLRESQVQGALERHLPVVPEPLRARYDSLLRISRKRALALEAALRARGEEIGRGCASIVRALGSLRGRLTSWGG